MLHKSQPSSSVLLLCEGLKRAIQIFSYDIIDIDPKDSIHDKQLKIILKMKRENLG